MIAPSLIEPIKITNSLSAANAANPSQFQKTACVKQFKNRKMTTTTLTFGKFKDQTFEWLFFHAPWYAHWLYDNNILGTTNDYDREEQEYFDELCRRASRLCGTCSGCETRPITHFEVGDLVGATGEGTVGLFCEKCFDETIDISFRVQPSFFSIERGLPRCAQLTVSKAIKDHFIGERNLTQRLMEEFFRTDEYFPNATPNFFVEEEVTA